jgi:Flp pilus assembly protein TadD
LKRAQLYDRTAITILSDHGESLGEHGEQEHGFFIYNSTVHIPLIVKPPAGSGIRPSHIERPVETIAVAPALLQFAGAKDEIEKQFSSPGLFESKGQNESAYSETFYPFSSFGWSPLHALETDRYHYIEAPTPELYDLTADPNELKNLAADQQATVAVLKDQLQQRLRNHPFSPAAGSDAQLSPDAQEKLRALGYISFRSPVSSAALAAGLPDPKLKIWEFNSILRAMDAFQARDFEKGKAILAPVREKDPQMYIVPFILGESALRQEDWQQAAVELKKCLELNPTFDQAMAALARALISLGNTTEARQWLEKALQSNPQNYRAWYELGYLESRNDKAAAITDYEKSISIQPNFAPVRRDLGMLQFQQGNYAEAAKHLAKAAELGLNEAPLFNFLGISYSRTQRLKQAVYSYQQALKLTPGYAEAHLNLGFAYQLLGQQASAAKEYAEACRLDNKLCQLVPRPPAAKSP